MPRVSVRPFGPLEHKALLAALVDVFVPQPAQHCANSVSRCRLADCDHL